MLRLLKWGLVIFAILTLIAALPFVIGGFRFFLHKAEITALLEKATPEEKRLPPLVHEMLVFSLQGKAAPYASQLVIWRVDGEYLQRRRTIPRVIAEVTWRSLFELDISEPDQLTLIAELAPTGEGRVGLSNASMALFGHPLSRLSAEEVATLILLVKEGSFYGRPEKVIPERDRFLLSYRASQRPT